eukprot:13184313-Ditylum_brightwellii.AAC.1
MTVLILMEESRKMANDNNIGNHWRLYLVNNTMYHWAKLARLKGTTASHDICWHIDHRLDLWEQGEHEQL